MPPLGSPGITWGVERLRYLLPSRFEAPGVTRQLGHHDRPGPRYVTPRGAGVAARSPTLWPVCVPVQAAGLPVPSVRICSARSCPPAPFGYSLVAQRSRLVNGNNAKESSSRSVWQLRRAPHRCGSRMASTNLQTPLLGLLVGGSPLLTCLDSSALARSPATPY